VSRQDGREAQADLRALRGHQVQEVGYPEHWRVLVCERCGKELAMFYGGKRDKKPAWVTF